jgi:threonyl-tRNA synthetase
MLVVGEKEQADGAVSVRRQGQGDLGAMPLADFTAKVLDEVKNYL